MCVCVCVWLVCSKGLVFHLQAFIDKFRFNAKRASLVQSRIKAIERLGQSELIEEDPEYIFRFPAAEPVSPPILGFMDVDFGYPGGRTLFRNLNFGIDMESRFAMVGPNGKLVWTSFMMHATIACLVSHTGTCVASRLYSEAKHVSSPASNAAAFVCFGFRELEINVLAIVCCLPPREARDILVLVLVDKGAEWHEQSELFLMKHNLPVFHKLHLEAIIDRAKLQHVKQFSSNSTSSSIIVYRTLQPEYRYAEYLSFFK